MYKSVIQGEESYISVKNCMLGGEEEGSAQSPVFPVGTLHFVDYSGHQWL